MSFYNLAQLHINEKVCRDKDLLIKLVRTIVIAKHKLF